MTRFREGTVDADCWRGIVDGNEYNLPDTIPASWVIVDIGTHVGSFVQACWNRGARNIWSYEADFNNHAVARENVGHLEGVNLYHYAVGRSDKRAQPTAHFGGYVPFFDGRINTGGGTALSAEGTVVSCIPFDDVIPFLKIDLLKIDCEGSEWPILFTSNLRRVRRIVGEYHSLPSKIERSQGLDFPCTPASLEKFLRHQGFQTVDVQPYNKLHAQMHEGQRIGLFSASR